MKVWTFFLFLKIAVVSLSFIIPLNGKIFYQQAYDGSTQRTHNSSALAYFSDINGLLLNYKVGNIYAISESTHTILGGQLGYLDSELETLDMTILSFLFHLFIQIEKRLWNSPIKLYASAGFGILQREFEEIAEDGSMTQVRKGVSSRTLSAGFVWTDSAAGQDFYLGIRRLNTRTDTFTLNGSSVTIPQREDFGFEMGWSIVF